MTKTINTLVNTYCAAIDAAKASAVDIRVMLKGQRVPLGDSKAVGAALLGPVSTYYKAALVDKVRGEGKTWDVTHAKYDAARKAHQRLVKDVMGESVSQSDELEIPANIAKLAAQLVAACAEYKEAAKLISTAIANAKAGK